MLTTPEPVSHNREVTTSSQRKRLNVAADYNGIYSSATTPEEAQVPSEDVASNFGSLLEELRAHINDVKRSCSKRQPAAASVERSSEHRMTHSTPVKCPKERPLQEHRMTHSTSVKCPKEPISTPLFRADEVSSISL